MAIAAEIVGGTSMPFTGVGSSLSKLRIADGIEMLSSSGRVLVV
jgi:hypothetical protein